MPQRALILRLPRFLGAVVMVVLALGEGRVAAQDSTLEHAVKATYLYKFIPFIVWPSAAFGSTGAPIDICVSADANFAALAGNAVAGQTVEHHPLAVRRVTTPAEEAGCQVLFVGTGDSAVRSADLAAVRGKPVLTVTDGVAGAAHGIVNFVLRDDRVRFEIDLAQAAQNGIAISSKLLSLAVAVRPASEEGGRP